MHCVLPARLVFVVLVLSAAPAALTAQTVMGRVVDSVSHRPVAHLPVRLIPGSDSARDTVFASSETANDGVFTIMAPAPGIYRVRLGDGHVGPAVTLATTDATDAHEYVIAPVPRVVNDTSMYHVLRGAELENVLRSGRPLLACQVEKEAATVPGSIFANYPTELRSRGASGSTIAQFVVDTLGRAEMSTLRIWRTAETDSAFVVAARAALARGRFYPASAGGHLVRQLVKLPMNFYWGNGRHDQKELRAAGCAPIGGESDVVSAQRQP